MTNKNNISVTPMIDESVLNELKLIMDDEFSDVLQVFLEESISLMSDIHTAFDEESDNLASAVNALNACSKNVGAMCLKNITESMEKHIVNADIVSAKNRLEALQDAFSQSHALIKIYMQDNVNKVA